MKHLDLFSGIGGFALACEWVGIDTIGFVEIEPFCQKVLKKHWPNVPIIGDIKDVRGDTFPTPVDLITGGFPCQPFSQAGKRRGQEDNRYLWPTMCNVIKEYKPSWVIGENVTGIVDMALEQVLFDLENIGYETQPFIIPACAIGGGHRRYRVWVLAHSNCNRLFKNELQENINREVDYKGFFHDNDLLNRIEQSPKCIRGNDGLSSKLDKHRVKALGNAIVPQVAFEILKGIVEIESKGINAYE